MVTRANFEMPFDAGELAGLPLETDCPSRIVIEQDNHRKVKYPPFDEDDFTRNT